MVGLFKPPSRNQLAKMAKNDHELVRFLEKIFNQIAAITTGTFIVPGADIYGVPYHFAEEPDQSFYYSSWQRVDASAWKAQRYDPEAVELVTLTGANPQPATLADFQALF